MRLPASKPHQRVETLCRYLVHNSSNNARVSISDAYRGFLNRMSVRSSSPLNSDNCSCNYRQQHPILFSKLRWRHQGAGQKYIAFGSRQPTWALTRKKPIQKLTPTSECRSGYPRRIRIAARMDALTPRGYFTTKKKSSLPGNEPYVYGS